MKNLRLRSTRDATHFRAKACTLAIIAALAGLASVPVFAAEATGAVRQYSIPAGKLSDVLAQYAATAGVQLLIDPVLLGATHSQGLQGSYGVDEGFSLLLQGSRFEAVRQGSGAYLLRGSSKGASEGAFSPATTTLPVVLVHGNVDDDVLQQRMSLSAAKIIVDRKEIETFGDVSMGEVIRRMPSISFGGPPGENNDARVRGLAKEYTQILIDGQPVPGRDFAIDQIPAHLVDRIEIIRSTTANIDNQGIAGTVNIIMRRPSKEDSSRWYASAGLMPDAPADGKFGSAGFSLGRNLGEFRYQFDGGLQRRNGVRTKDRQDYNNGGSTLTNREVDYEYRVHDEAALSARLIWQPNAVDEFRLDPRYLYSSESKERDRLKKANLADAERMDQAKTRQYLGLNGQWQRKLDSSTRYLLGFNLQGTQIQTDKTERKGAAGQSFSNLPTFVSGNDDLVRERGFSLRGSTQQRLGRIHALDVGFEIGVANWQMDKLGWKQQNRSDQARTAFTVDESKLAVYAQDEILIGERHVLTPGLRIERVKTRTDNSQNGRGERTHIQPSPSIHWLTSVTDQWNWRASVSRSIRRPKFEDMAGLTETKAGTLANPDAIGNSSLKPETSWGFETGIEHLFVEKRGVASANLFYRKLTDLIEKTIVLDAGSGRYQQMPINTAKAETWGVEFDGSYRFDLSVSHAVTLRGNYSWMDSRVDDARTGGKRPINDQPEHILNAGIDYEYKPWKFKVGAHFNQVGKLQKVDLAGSNARTQRQEPSRYLDLSAAWPLAKDLTVRLSALNVLEAEKNRPRTTVRPNGTIALFEQEDEKSSRAFQLRLEGRF